MKKNFLMLSMPALIIMSCSKQEGNKGVIVLEEATDSVVISNEGTVDSLSTTSVPTAANGEIQEHTYRYVATDGSNAHVKFVNSDKENYITVTSNKKTIRADQTEALAKGAIYKNDDIEIKSEGDNISITQGNSVIELKKAGGQ